MRREESFITKTKLRWSLILNTVSFGKTIFVYVLPKIISVIKFSVGIFVRLLFSVSLHM